MRAWQQAGFVIGTGVATGVITAGIVSAMAAAKIAKAFHPPPYLVKGPLVSVIVPALQEEDYLPDLLETISNQTYTPIETIIVDSSTSPSMEKTQDICRRYGAQYVYVPKLNVAHARNEGARRARGGILAFIDADCFLASDYMERIVYALEQGYVLVHGVDPNIDGMFYSIPSVITRMFFKPKGYTTGRGIGIWRKEFWEIGGYDEEYDPMQGYREDLKLGQDVIRRFGLNSIKLLRGALLGTDPRREKIYGFRMWKVRGVRGSEAIGGSV